MKLGAHVSISQGLSGALRAGESIDAEVIQVFTSNPKGWNFNVRGEQEISDFKKIQEKSNISQIFGHSIYLTNLASSNNYIYTNSINSLISGLVLAEKAGFSGVVTHIGSHGEEPVEKGLERVVNALKQALSITENKVPVILETDSGAGTHLGGKFEEIAAVLRRLPNSNLGVCFDTCHSFVAGYDIRTPEKFNKVMKEFDKLIGLKYLKIFHLNDSKGALGSHLDRHEVIGEGQIGPDTFKHIVSSDSYADIPGVIETPDNKGVSAEASSLRKLWEFRDGNSKTKK